MIRSGPCTAQDRHGDRAYESSSPSPVTRMVSVSSRASASAQDVSAGWHDGTCLPLAPSPRNTHVPAGEERSWEGGKSRVQAERPTCQKSTGARERPGR